MEKIENLTREQLEIASKEAGNAGYQETQSIENIPVGECHANAVLIEVEKKKTPCFALIKFERKDSEGKSVKLMFEAAKLDVLHISTGKSFNNIYAKISPELKDVLSIPANFTKFMLFNSEGFTDSRGRNRTMLKFDSISL